MKAMIKLPDGTRSYSTSSPDKTEIVSDISEKPRHKARERKAKQ
jgi:hypothetical protein